MKPDRANKRRPPRVHWAVLILLASVLLAYSQAVAYFGNEPFHLLAAQLINAGKKPYLDFFYQHPPLYIYLNAAWMQVFGENWRSAHVFSALLTGTSMVVVANYVYSRLSDTQWRAAISAISALLMGLNFYMICFGTVGLPFGLCLALTVVSFRLTVAAIHTRGELLPFLAGLSAGASAASSLLTAPVLMVLVAWLAWNIRSGGRLRKLFSFAGGAAIPFLPLILLGALAPRQAFFDIVEYHLFHRVGSEGNMIRWNLREILDWFGSIQGLVLMGLAAIGLFLTVRQPRLDQRRRAELYLCAWLTAVLSVYLAIPRPTFSFYFVLITPFVTILAAIGLEAVGTLSPLSKRRVQVMTAVIVLYSIGLGLQVYKLRREIFYADHNTMAAIARDVNQVTPPDGWVFAFEHVYFEAGRIPPPGLENAFDPHSRKDEWLGANRFATVCLMANDARISSLGLFERYSKNKAFSTPNFTAYLFWDLKEPPAYSPR